MNKKLLILNIILIVILVAEVTLIMNAYTSQKAITSNFESGQKTLQSSISPTPSTSSIENEAILLPEAFEWNEVNIQNQDSLYATNLGSTLYSDSGELKISYTGQEWLTKIDVGSMNEQSEKKKLLNNYFDSYLESKGWTQKISHENIELSTVAADGPMSSIWGYVKSDTNSMRFVLLENGSQQNGFTTAGLPDCPCSSTFRIFISSVIPLQEAIAAVKN